MSVPGCQQYDARLFWEEVKVFKYMGTVLRKHGEMDK